MLDELRTAWFRHDSRLSGEWASTHIALHALRNQPPAIIERLGINGLEITVMVVLEIDDHPFPFTIADDKMHRPHAARGVQFLSGFGSWRMAEG